MTCRYDAISPLDILYTAVRDTGGGVGDAASYLTQRRGRTISGSALRLRLRNVDENRLSQEMFDLLIEWLQEHRSPAVDEVCAAWAAQFGFRLVRMGEAVTEHTVAGLAADVLTLASHTGRVAEGVSEAIEDGRITKDEADSIMRAVRANQRALDTLGRKAVALSKRPRG